MTAIVLVGVLYGTLDLWRERPQAHPPGVLVPRVPDQAPLEAVIGPYERAGWKIEPVARFSVEARVLGKERYRWDSVASLSPVDLALGWGRMSDSAVLEQLEISQSARFYFYRYRSPPIAPNEITESSANMHLIPASAAIEDALAQVRRGQLVRVSGYLVNASHPSGGTWRSSTTRADSGAGACEIIWVTALSVR